MDPTPDALEQGLESHVGYHDCEFKDTPDCKTHHARLLGVTSDSKDKRRKKKINAFHAVKLTVIFILVWAYVNFSILSSFPWLRSPICRSLGTFFPTCGDWTDLSNEVLDAFAGLDDQLNDFPQTQNIPQYVFKYAPYVHLYSGEEFWPSSISEHLLHTTPEIDYDPIEARQQIFNLSNLDELNRHGKGQHVFLTSNDNVEKRPKWLSSEKNIPSDFFCSNCTEASRPSGGRSSAPAVLIVVNKGHGILDAFWFYFYSYNLGNTVFTIRFGNHVGDWEHSLIRFQYGKPKLVYYSEHNFGAAYSYSAVEKIGKRPVVYSAEGSHAMYATPGIHPYILPLGILHDETDRGPLWDPSLNVLTYTYNYLNDTLIASTCNPDAPTQWFYFAGHWGDKFYPLSDPRQYGLAGEYHYVNGPLGPRFKHLGRRKVCQGPYSEPCVIKHWLEAEGLDTPRTERGVGEGEDWPDDEELMPPGLRDGENE